ncbi:MAG TPA: glycosyltransferase family 2 protein [Acidimicrobiales bacterium]
MASALGAFVLILLIWGCAQFVWVLAFGSRRRGAIAGADGRSAAEEFALFFLIACLNEEEVIGETVAAALENEGATVVLVDDASDDRTAALAAAAGGERVIVCRRELPAARLGKGPALNHGFDRLVREVHRRCLDPGRVVVVVMDADGRLSPGAVVPVLACFADPRVGGVQLPVRIRNRTSLLTKMQDFEFWGVSAMAQLARIRSGSVSLGGNGQFTRLSALLGLGRDPWSDSLTEDLDLAVSLLVEGWRLSSTPDAYVSQQGVDQLDRLIRQRTRWFQGHITCSARIPEMWRSNRMSGTAFVETTAYLLAPLLLVLPWSVLFTWGLYRTACLALGAPPVMLWHNPAASRLAVLATWYVISFAPMLVAAVIYHRRSDTSLLRSFGYAHLAMLGSYLTFAATWKAVGRVLGGREGWAKTARARESGGPATSRPDPAVVTAGSAMVSPGEVLVATGPDPSGTGRWPG